MHRAGSKAALPPVLGSRFHCSTANGSLSTQVILGPVLQFRYWTRCRACGGATAAAGGGSMVLVVVLLAVVVVVVVRPGGGGGLRGARGVGGQSSLLGGAGQGCSQLGTVCRHGWGGHWAMLPAGGPSAPTLHHALLPPHGGRQQGSSSSSYTGSGGMTDARLFLTHRWILASLGTPWKAAQASGGVVHVVFT